MTYQARSLPDILTDFEIKALYDKLGRTTVHKLANMLREGNKNERLKTQLKIVNISKNLTENNFL